MFAYQKTQRFFAQLADGLSELGVRELARLGAKDVKAAYRGVYFSADHAALYRINYHTQLCTRIMAPLLTFDCHSDKYLYKTARSLPWTELLSLKTTFAIFANVADSNIHHSQFAARRVKDAIVDQFRETCGDRPNVDPREPDVWINLYITNNKATISLETSGGSLHRRGYRQPDQTAPMQETVAAAIIQFTNWNGERPLYDPMCGSGTLLTEALMHACQIPAGYLRPHFGFERLPDFNHEVWRQVKQASDAQIRPLPPGLIGGSDCAADMVNIARKSCQMLPGGHNIALQTQRFQDLGDLNEAVIVCNPPYGVRLSNAKATAALLHDLEAFLKTRCRGAAVYLYLGQASLFEQLTLWPAWKKPLKNGGLEGFLVKYKIR